LSDIERIFARRDLNRAVLAEVERQQREAEALLAQTEEQEQIGKLVHTAANICYAGAGACGIMTGLFASYTVWLGAGLTAALTALLLLWAKYMEEMK